MKIKLFILGLLSLFLVSTTSFATEVEPNKRLIEQEFRTQVLTLKDRLEFLKEQKKEADTKAEKLEIQREIKGIKKEAKELKQQQAGGGIYIGGGVLLALLVLLLIL